MLCAWYAIVMHKIVYICTYSEMKSCRLTVCTWLLFWTLCRAGRFVYGLKLPLSTHKAIHIVSPPYLCDLLQHHRPTRSMHSSDILLLSVPRHNLDFGSRAFRVVAIQAAVNGNKKLFAFNNFPYYYFVYIQSKYCCANWADTAGQHDQLGISQRPSRLVRRTTGRVQQQRAILHHQRLFTARTRERPLLESTHPVPRKQGWNAVCLHWIRLSSWWGNWRRITIGVNNGMGQQEEIFAA